MIIYALIDPRTSEIRYIGKANDPIKRLSQHKRDKPHLRKTRWLRQLCQLGMEPSILILETVTSNWQEAERQWISHYRRLGCRLTNLTDGGDGVSGLDVESRRRLSDTRKVLFQNMAFRSKMMTIYHDPTRRSKIAVALTGIAKTENAITKSAQAHRGKPLKLSASERLSRKTRGHRWSTDEARIIAKSNRGNNYGFGNKSRTGQKKSVAEKLKISLALKGNPKSEQWKKQMREIALKRWEKVKNGHLHSD